MSRGEGPRVSQPRVLFCLQDSNRPNSLVDSVVSAVPSPPQIEVYDDLDSVGDHLIQNELPATAESNVLLINLTRAFVSSSLCLKKLENIIFGWAKYRIYPVFLDMLSRDLHVKGIHSYDHVLVNYERRKYEAENVERELALTRTAAGRSMARDETASVIVENLVGRVFRRSKCRSSIAMSFLVVINLLLEIGSVAIEQLSSTSKPYLATITLVISVVSVVLSIIDLVYKIRTQNVCFRCKWPIPWFYYPTRNWNRIFGNFTDTVLLFCVFGQLVVSGINYGFIQKGRQGPIKGSLWPLFFAIAMVIAKFMEKPIISRED